MLHLVEVLLNGVNLSYFEVSIRCNSIIFSQDPFPTRTTPPPPTTAPAHLHTRFTPDHSTPPPPPPTSHQLHLQFHTRSVLAKSKSDWSILCFKNNHFRVQKGVYSWLLAGDQHQPLFWRVTGSKVNVGIVVGDRIGFLLPPIFISWSYWNKTCLKQVSWDCGKNWLVSQY